MFSRGVARFPTFGKMYRSNRVRCLAAHQSGRGNGFRSSVCRLLQHAVDDAAQDTLRKTFSRRINRRDSPKMNRHLFIVFDDLELWMIDANSFSTQTRLAENDDALTRSDHFLHVMQIEPATDERLTQRIRLGFLQRRFKDFLPAAKPAHRCFDHLAAETDGNVGFFPRKLWELGPILVTPRKMRYQILRRLDP